MIANLLADGRARVAEMLQKGYAPTHFSHNLELILVEDNRSPTSSSMKAKIASTSERSARLRMLDSNTLIWWATAFPMRQWSGGRKMSSSTFDTLTRHAPKYAVQAPSLLVTVSDDLDRLRQKHARCAMFQSFLESKRAIPVCRRAQLTSSRSLRRGRASLGTIFCRCTRYVLTFG